MPTDFLPDIPPNIAAWWYWTALCLAVIIIGIAKSGFGGGIGILAVPLVANALPADRTLGFMLPMLMACDLFAVAQHRKNISKSHVGYLLTGAVLGIGCAGVLLWYLKGEQGSLATPLKLTVGIVCLVFVGLQFFRMLGGKVPSVLAGSWGGRGTGFLAGSTSTLAHAAGPVVSIYLLEEKLGKSKFTGTNNITFFVINWLKLPIYLVLTLITWETLKESAIFLPLVPVGAMLGIWMHHRVPEKPFTFVIYLATLAAAVKMLYDGLAG